MRGQGVRRHQGQGVAPDVLRPLQGQLMEGHRLRQGQLFHPDESMVKANCHFDFSPLLLAAFLRAGEDERREDQSLTDFRLHNFCDRFGELLVC